jgi:hypothetical protein
MTDKFYDLTNPNFVGIMWRFGLHIISLIIFIRFVYFRYNRKEKYVFSFFLMGILAFLITSMLLRVTIEMGMAVGLFAVLAILRLRSRNYSVKDMAYIFSIFGVSVINALKVFNFPLLGILIIDSLIIGSAYVLEQFIIKYRSETHSIIYDDLELLKPGKKEKLLKDISERTGKEIIKVKICRINYKRKRARLNIYYRD